MGKKIDRMILLCPICGHLLGYHGDGDGCPVSGCPVDNCGDAPGSGPKWDAFDAKVANLTDEDVCEFCFAGVHSKCVPNIGGGDCCSCPCATTEVRNG